jgi:hypothetical protein
MRRARITVERSAAEAVTLEPKSDLIDLGSIDTLRLVDVETGGSTWTLVCYSLEWDANRVEPTAGGNLRTGSDADLISNLVSEVPTWSAGTINSFTGSLNFVFNHAHRHEALRRIERNVPGEIQFESDGTVNYTSRLGTDKSGSVTLSATNQNIEDEINIVERGRELDGTHVRVLGAHEGEAQIFANLVPADDSATYENRVNYTTSRWSDGDTRDWDRWENKDVSDQATIEEEAAALGDEITEQLVEAKATVSGVDLSVGDTVQVVKADADLNRAMRVHRIKTVADGAKQVDEVLLSTRTVMRNDDSADLRDIQRFNTAFQGSAVWGTPSGGIQAVDSGLNYQLSFFYPDVEYEHLAELQVKSLPYRAFSSGAAAAATGAFTGVATDQLGSKTTLKPGDSVTFSATVPSVGTNNYDGGWIEERLFLDPDFADEPSARLPIDLNSTLTATVETTPSGRLSWNNTNWFLNEGETTSVTVVNEGSEDWILPAGDGLQLNEVQHSHAPDPGVTEFPGETASGVDVIVNGSTVATDIGTGEFETEVDISNELTRGAWNNVEVSSGTLGLLICTLGLEAYRQIGKS